jgi:hypothetical protein
VVYRRSPRPAFRRCSGMLSLELPTYHRNQATYSNVLARVSCGHHIASSVRTRKRGSWPYSIRLKSDESVFSRMTSFTYPAVLSVISNKPCGEFLSSNPRHSVRFGTLRSRAKIASLTCTCVYPLADVRSVIFFPARTKNYTIE